MKFEPNANGAEFLDIYVNGLLYEGPMELTQYFIRNMRMTKNQDESIDVIIILGRRLLGRVTSQLTFNLTQKYLVE